MKGEWCLPWSWHMLTMAGGGNPSGAEWSGGEGEGEGCSAGCL